MLIQEKITEIPKKISVAMLKKPQQEPTRKQWVLMALEGGIGAIGMDSYALKCLEIERTMGSFNMQYLLTGLVFVWFTTLVFGNLWKMYLWGHYKALELKLINTCDEEYIHNHKSICMPTEKAENKR